MRTFAASTIVLAFLFHVPAASAQAKLIGGIGGGMANPTALLEIKGVQEDLKLKEDQVAKVAALSKKYTDETKDLKGRELFTKAREVADAINKEVDKVLSEDQVKRLKQLKIQQQGPRALFTPDVSKELELTGEQTKKVRELISDSAAKRKQIIADAAGNREKMQAMIAELDKEIVASAVKELSKEQAKKWNDLVGPAFKGTLPPAAGGVGTIIRPVPIDPKVIRLKKIERKIP